MPKKSKKKDFANNIKIITVGDVKTGKTCFSTRWTKSFFYEFYKETKVSEFLFKTYESNGKLYQIQVWDLSGNDNNLMLTKIFAKDTYGILYISDASNIETRKNLLIKKSILDEVAKFKDGEKIPSILIENKSDLLEDDIIKTREEEIKKFAEDNGFDGGFLVSSKNAENINESMDFLISLIIKRIEKAKEMGIVLESSQSEEENILELDGEEVEIEIKKSKENLISIKIDKNEENEKRYHSYFNPKGYYYYENSLDNLKNDYEILSSIENVDEFKDIFKKLEKSKRVKINYYLKKVVIQIGVLVTNLEGEDEEITFELIYNKNEEKLNESLVKEIIEIKKSINELEKKIKNKKKINENEKNEELK